MTTLQNYSIAKLAEVCQYRINEVRTTIMYQRQEIKREGKKTEKPDTYFAIKWILDCTDLLIDERRRKFELPSLV